ncbi:cache domain-containing protein [Candidatus Dojkabacteria bacterium]|uniref:Cache domain-containing protein n=1 Tax=Candidatus Dojkabacteria bacterium TaxID=2099670 RepID=A0A955I5A1_9BACT|nr:cache domain-containing protein [Candidatus Dojkabacteria bacterium]
MLNFWLQNFAYVLYILLGFILLAAAWLYADASRKSGRRNEQVRAFGFGLLGLGMLFRVFIGSSMAMGLLSFVVVVLGLLLVLLAVRREPILPSKIEELLPEEQAQPQYSVLPQVLFLLPFASAILSTSLAMSLRKLISKGQMKEYRYQMWGFAALAASELMLSLSALAASDIILVQSLFGEFGLVWWLQHLALVIVLACFVMWVWKYIKFRAKPELFISFASVAVIVSMLGGLLYAGFLFGTAESDLFRQLEKDVKILDVAVTNLEDNAQTAANLLAKNPQIISSFASSDYRALYNAGLLYADEAINVDDILFVDNGGQIVVETANQSQVGQSISDDQLVLYAVNEAKERVSVVEVSAVLAPELQIRAVSPVVGSEGSVIGVVQVRYTIDDAFVDSIKRDTGLETSVYAGDQRSATTILAEDGESRRENTKDTNQEVLSDVLDGNQNYTGNVVIVNEEYHGAYAPLHDTDGNTIGMLFVGRPRQLLLDAVESSLLNALLVSIIVSGLALNPAYLLARTLEKNYKA